MEAPEALRVDRWLWCARFFKTRSLAASAVRGGHVRLNGERVKAAREVKAGDGLHIIRGRFEYEITVIGIPARRGPVKEASALYEEAPASIERRREQSARRIRVGRVEAPTEGRPDKRTRRLIRKIRD